MSIRIDSPPEAIEIEPPDVSHLVTEDDTPVDNILSEKQMRLLTEPLYSSWKPGREFMALANVGLFFNVNEPPLVPDMMLSMDVVPGTDLSKKENRSYFIWKFGKPPEVVVEIVSNREGGETDRKMGLYAQIGVAHYVIFDPDLLVQDRRLRCYVLRNGAYQPMRNHKLSAVPLRLVEWEGQFEGCQDSWLRWEEADGQVIPTGEERASLLAAKLRELGVDPDSLGS